MMESEERGASRLYCGLSERLIMVSHGMSNRIFRPLRNTDQPKLSYVWRAWLITFVPSPVIGGILWFTLGLPSNQGMLPNESLLRFFSGMLLLSPWGETLLMWPILFMLKRAFQNIYRIALASAAFWGVLHGMFGLATGLGATWPFFILSLCFLEWEKKSKGSAIVVTASVHRCFNIVPAVVLALYRVLGIETI